MTDPVTVTKLPNKIFYASIQPGLKLYFGEESEPSIVFKNGSLIYDLDANPKDQKFVDYLDKMIEDHANIRGLVRKLDAQAAWRNLARNVAEAPESTRGITGQLNSLAMQETKVLAGFQAEALRQQLVRDGASEEDANRVVVEMMNGMTATTVDDPPAAPNAAGDLLPDPEAKASVAEKAQNLVLAAFGKKQ